MFYILISENFNMALFLKAFFLWPVYLRFPQKIDLGSGSDGLQKGSKIALVLLSKREKEREEIP